MDTDKIEVSEHSALRCDYCSGKSNVYYVFGGIDCTYTVILCPAHRQYFIEKIYIEIANKRARDKQIAQERERMKVIRID